MAQFIRLKPVFKETIWGGSALAQRGFDIPGDHTGEAWVTSAHPNGDCEIAAGEYQGKTLSWLWNEHQELFGNIGGDRFPLLVKVIHAKQDLSIQVHPDNRYARRHENGSLGKAECWYILDCEPGADIIVGHSANSDEALCEEIDHGEWNKLLHPRPIHPGDFFYIARARCTPSAQAPSCWKSSRAAISHLPPVRLRPPAERQAPRFAHPAEQGRDPEPLRGPDPDPEVPLHTRLRLGRTGPQPLLHPLPRPGV